MRVAACQVPDVREDVPQALAIVRERAEQAAASDADVILFPECFLQGYFTDAPSVQRLAISLDEEDFQPLLKLSRTISTTIIVGLIERASDGCYNAAVVLRDGDLLGCYRKSALLETEGRAFESGSEFPVLEIADRSVGINICYDLCFTEPAHRVAEQAGEVLLCPCNNMLSYSNAESWKEKHNAIRQERCRESGLWLVSSDVTGERDGKISYGPTAVIDPNGVIVDQVPLLTEGMLIVDI